MISKLVASQDYAPNYDFQKSHDPYMELMEKCKESFIEDGIFVSVDTSELPIHKDNKAVLDIIQAALELTRLECIDASMQEDRFIRIRTRNLQNKTFIKIQYSNGSLLSPKYDSLEKTITRKVEYARGYFKHQIENDAGVVKIALPIS